MKKFLSFLILSAPIFVAAQDCKTANFADSNQFPSPTNLNVGWSYFCSVSFVSDTAVVPLWQIGNTHKSFFCYGSSVRHGVMTDTLNPYPVNSNNWFTLIIKDIPINPYIKIWHRYKTTSGKDGGIVEFSSDSGATWFNVIGGCTSTFGSEMFTTGFYTLTDTLENGQAAFTGISDSQCISTIQVANCVGVTPPPATLSPCNFAYSQRLDFRFRFLSDSTPDSLNGWMIDSIRVCQGTCAGKVADKKTNIALVVIPNPSTNGIFSFPALIDEKHSVIEVYNALGNRILNLPYCYNVDLSSFPLGFYYYRVITPTGYFRGELLKE